MVICQLSFTINSFFVIFGKAWFQMENVSKMHRVYVRNFSEKVVKIFPVLNINCKCKLKWNNVLPYLTMKPLFFS